jgi:mono/diheme cytochrome c family protein
VVPGPRITVLHTLGQNWSDESARSFYNLPQGSQLIPYAWFLFLEQPQSTTLFRDAEHIRQLGYLPRQPDQSGNSDGLPVGFVQDGGYLGITCAACHTNQINYRGTAWLVDGAPTLGDFETLLRRLLQALDRTLNDSAKFERFAAGVLGSGNTPAASSSLQQLLRDRLEFRQAYNARNLPRAGSAPFGPGRVDAFGAIMNEVATTFAQVPGNDAPADAPVSYPFLWDTPQHDVVQWNGAAPNRVVAAAKLVVGTAHVGALGRNSGEVMGVFGNVDAKSEGDLLKLHGYPSSLRKLNLIKVEEMLRDLWSPQWPAELPAIDSTLRDAGQALFATHCSRCHDDETFHRNDPQRVVVAAMSDSKTDPTMAANFAARRAKTGVLEGRSFHLIDFRTLGSEESVKDMLFHLVERAVAYPDGGQRLLPRLRAPAELLASFNLDFGYQIHADIKLGDRTISGAFDRLNLVNGKVREAFSHDPLRLVRQATEFKQDLTAARAEFMEKSQGRIRGDDMAGLTSAVSRAGTQLAFAQPVEIAYKYKGRPLNGIWATAPYLHNGSVPNLDELLKPTAKRIKKFRLGSREFDPVKVGFVSEGNFEFDTSLKGNSNAGHEYGEFGELERRQLIEYMKSL